MKRHKSFSKNHDVEIGTSKVPLAPFQRRCPRVVSWGHAGPVQLNHLCPQWWRWGPTSQAGPRVDGWALADTPAYCRTLISPSALPPGCLEAAEMENAFWAQGKWIRACPFKTRLNKSYIDDALLRDLGIKNERRKDFFQFPAKSEFQFWLKKKILWETSEILVLGGIPLER